MASMAQAKPEKPQAATSSAEIASTHQRMLYGVALMLAPLLMGLGTFFWRADGELSATSGILQVYSFVFWIPALLGLLALLRPTMPRFSAWGVLLVAWVCLAGNNFGMEGVYLETALATGGESFYQAINEAMGPGQILALYIPGLFFPLTLLLLAGLLLRQGAIPLWCALLFGLGALGFPLSRIPRLEIIAHLADLLLLIPLAWIGWGFLQDKIGAQSDPAA